MNKNYGKNLANKFSKLLMALLVCGGFHAAYAQSDNLTQGSSSADVGQSQSGGTADGKKSTGRLRSSTTDAFGATNTNGNMGDPKNSTQTGTRQSGPPVQSNSLSASSGVERTGNTGETAGEWSGTKGKKDPNTDTTSKHNHSD